MRSAKLRSRILERKMHMNHTESHEVIREYEIVININTWINSASAPLRLPSVAHFGCNATAHGPDGSKRLPRRLVIHEKVEEDAALTQRSLDVACDPAVD